MPIQSLSCNVCDRMLYHPNAIFLKVLFLWPVSLGIVVVVPQVSVALAPRGIILLVFLTHFTSLHPFSTPWPILTHLTSFETFGPILAHYEWFSHILSVFTCFQPFSFVITCFNYFDCFHPFSLVFVILFSHKEIFSVAHMQDFLNKEIIWRKKVYHLG